MSSDYTPEQVREYSRQITVTDENGSMVYLTALELQAFVTSLPDEMMNIPVVVASPPGHGEKQAAGWSALRISIDFDKSGPVLLLETEETLR